MKHLIPTLSLAALAFSSCTAEQTQSAPTTESANSAKSDSDHGHGEKVKLDPAVLGTTPITVYQSGHIEAGAEAFIDVEAAADTPLPETLRGWIGIESGKGSRKSKFDAPINNKVHGHIEVPDPIPEGSKLWLEAGEMKTSIALNH